MRIDHLGAHYIRIVGVGSSNLLRSTTQETSFVYQDKRGFLRPLKNSRFCSMISSINKNSSECLYPYLCEVGRV